MPTYFSGSAAHDTINRLEQRLAQVRGVATDLLEAERRAGHDQLEPDSPSAIRIRAALGDAHELETQLDTARSEAARMGTIPPGLAAATRQTTPSRSSAMNTSSIYRPGSRTSYLRDLMRVGLPGHDSDGSSTRRLAEHAGEVASSADYIEHRDLDRVDGSGGYATPPAWLMNQYITLARPGRAFANLVQRQPLPGGTDSINIPKLLTGTSTAVQIADNTQVEEVDLTDTFISAPVRTIAGQQSVAIQLLDQSPIAFDEVIFQDLFADYAQKTDLQTLYGNGVNGQVLGVANTPNIQSIPIGSLDIRGLYNALAHAIELVHTTRLQPPTAIVMHPRRWSWCLSLLDDVSRPLFVPSGNGPMNAAGVLTDVASEAVVGRTHGLPVIVDANITTTAGTTTDEDVIIVLRASDIVLYESGLRARALPEPKAGTLTVLLQVFGYLAFTASRYPEGIVQITGLTPPTWT